MKILLRAIIETFINARSIVETGGMAHNSFFFWDFKQERDEYQTTTSLSLRFLGVLMKFLRRCVVPCITQRFRGKNSFEIRSDFKLTTKTCRLQMHKD